MPIKRFKHSASEREPFDSMRSREATPLAASDPLRLILFVAEGSFQICLSCLAISLFVYFRDFRETAQTLECRFQQRRDPNTELRLRFALCAIDANSIGNLMQTTLASLPTIAHCAATTRARNDA